MEDDGGGALLSRWRMMEEAKGDASRRSRAAIAIMGPRAVYGDGIVQ
jgi:hypothetical protein